MLGSVRARVTLLLLISVVPLVFMAVALAFDSYFASLARSREFAAAGLRKASVRHDAALDHAIGTIARIAAQPRDAVCPLLAGAAVLEPTRYAGLAVLDAYGRVECQAGEPGVAAIDWASDPGLEQSRRGEPALGRLGAVPGSNAMVLPIFVSTEGKSEPQAIVAAALRLDWLAGQDGARGADGDLGLWLLDPASRLHALDGASDDRLPPPQAQRPLFSVPASAAPVAALDGVSRHGEAFAYAIGPVRGGYALLAAYRSAAIQAAAHDALIRHLLEITVALVVGLLIMGGGTDRAVVQPLKRLTAAVNRWRGGGPFDSFSLHGMPTEVVDLSQAFSHATGALAEHEAQLRSAVAQQHLLMQEIHHRVKNNLQIVASLLNLQASRIRAPEAKAEFQAARDRVRALATLHRHLYADGELRTINMRSFLMELSGQLFQAMGEREGDRITLTVDAPELQMSSDQAVPLSLIVTEAVSNAIKYAFPGGRRGRVAVHLAADKDIAHLVIEDDGIGIPAGSGESESGPRDGLGIQLIRGFARQLGATLTVQEGNGTRYELDIPLHAERAESDERVDEVNAAA
ncbi:MAG: sensor histidine kinase [Alphaproteobacteria bacterium]|nr:sensor histidine kinase [Alphaproteobacteria bacterium]